MIIDPKTGKEVVGAVPVASATPPAPAGNPTVVPPVATNPPVVPEKPMEAASVAQPPVVESKPAPSPVAEIPMETVESAPDLGNMAAVEPSVPDVVADAESAPSADKKAPSKQVLLMLVLVAVVFVLMVLLAAILFLGQQKKKLSTAPVVTPTVFQRAVVPSSEPTVAVTPLPTLSSDNSVPQLQKELNETPIDDFSTDITGIQKDINGL